MTNAWDMMILYQELQAEEERLSEELKILMAQRDKKWFKVSSCLSVLRFELLVLEHCLKQNAFTKEEQEAIRDELEELRNQYYQAAM